MKRAFEFGKPDFESLKKAVMELEARLTLRSYIVGYSLTLADVVVWGIIRGNRRAAAGISAWININRWLTFIETSNPWIKDAMPDLHPKKSRRKPAAHGSTSMASVASRGTSGPVVMRFPPEPSGYLHIGHVKAALLNDMLAHDQPGGMIH